MTINVSFDYPPIPIRSADWSACVDGQEEDGHYGRGETREKALVDLGGKLAAEGDIAGFIDVLAQIIRDDIEAEEAKGCEYAWWMARGMKKALATVEGIV